MLSTMGYVFQEHLLEVGLDEREVANSQHWGEAHSLQWAELLQTRGASSSDSSKMKKLKFTMKPPGAEVQSAEKLPFPSLYDKGEAET